MAVTDYTPILGKASKEYNVGGGISKIYICSKAKATAIPRPLALVDPAATNASEFVEISDPITFGVGDGWIPVTVTRDTVKLESDYTTERDSSGFSVKASADVAGANAEDIGNLQLAANDEVLVLIPLPDGKRLLLGSDQFAAEVKYKFNIGENAKGGRKSTISIDAFEVAPFFYTGAITLAT